MMVVSLNGIDFVFKKLIKNFKSSLPGCELPHGSLRLSFVIALVAVAQLSVAMSISRAVIFLLLMTSGDVERNPGPEQSPTSTLHEC